MNEAQATLVKDCLLHLIKKILSRKEKIIIGMFK